MYCKKCQNIMDITNNLNKPIQTAGADIPDNNTTNNSSNFDISYSDNLSFILSGGSSSSLSDLIISNAILNKPLPPSLNPFSLDDINKFKSFTDLSPDLKIIVFNKLLDLTDTKTSHITHDNNDISTYPCFFYCKNCGNHENIPPRSLLFSRHKNKKNDFDTNFSLFKFDHTLPFTKKYSCINPSCPSHSNPSSKYAVFFRINNSYNIKYLCCLCDSSWLSYTSS